MAAKAKKKNLQALTDDELSRELDGIRKTLFDLRVRRVTDVVENPAAFRLHRHQIARLETERSARRNRKAAEAAAAKKAASKAAPAKKPATPAAK